WLPTSAAALAVVLLLTLAIFFMVWGQRLDRLQARETLSQFEDEKQQAQSLILPTRVADGEEQGNSMRQGFQALERYQVLDNPPWLEAPGVRRLSPTEQERLRQDAGELLLLLARATLLEAARPREEALQVALRLNRLAESCYPAEQVPQVLWKQR